LPKTRPEQAEKKRKGKLSTLLFAWLLFCAKNMEMKEKRKDGFNVNLTLFFHEKY
jgi:hypothetical protein